MYITNILLRVCYIYITDSKAAGCYLCITFLQETVLLDIVYWHENETSSALR